MTKLFVNVKNETRNANNERTKFDSSNYLESVAFIEKSEQSLGDEIWAKNKFYLFIPNDTNSEGKILTKTKIPENSGNAATINSEGDGRGEWDDYLSFEDRFSYGVEWQVNDLSTVSRIGNPLLHEDLPIQNEYRGCYYDLQNKKVLYWYDPENWENVIPSNIEGNELYAGKYPAFNGVDMYYTKSGNTFTSTPYTGTAKSGIASKNNLVDYSDSNIANDTAPRYSVMVHTPKFYGKSGWYEKNGVVYNWVRISPMKIAGDWVEIPEMFVSAYHATTYNSNNIDEPTNNFRLESSKIKNYDSYYDNLKAVSVLNLDTHYLGGGYNGGGEYGGKGGSDDGSPNLHSSVVSNDSGSRNGIPRTGGKHYHFSKWCENNYTLLLPYEYYKWMFFWNYVIEYCNFNCLVDFNSLKQKNEVTINGVEYNNLVIGVSLGGLGVGLSYDNTIDDESYSGYWINKCGYCNSEGNKTSYKPLVKSSITYNVPKWRGFENPFGGIITELGGIFIKSNSGNKWCEVYTTLNYEQYDSNTHKLSNQLDFSCIGLFESFLYSSGANDSSKLIKEYKINNKGDMFPYKYVDITDSTAYDISILKGNYTNNSLELRKVSTGYRLNYIDKNTPNISSELKKIRSLKRPGLGCFIFNDILDVNFFTFFGFRFVSIP